MNKDIVALVLTLVKYMEKLSFRSAIFIAIKLSIILGLPFLIYLLLIKFL